MPRRKPLNHREAARIAREHGGPLCTAKVLNGPGYGRWNKCIVQIHSIGNVEVLGAHHTSWRKAFEAAGVFDI
ncbi:MAG: hypothetical protein JJU00_14815 [Opitutales bacterium]|nr:hypothetical protein [Opitutales bacterium]